jgi:hypothetical protein
MSARQLSDVRAAYGFRGPAAAALPPCPQRAIYVRIRSSAFEGEYESSLAKHKLSKR